MLDLVAKYSNETNAHRINEDIVLNLREKDDFIKYLDEVNKELTKMLPFVKYLGYSYNDNVRNMRKMQDAKDVGGGPKKGKTEKLMSMGITYSRIAIFKFRLTIDGKQRTINMPIYIPIYKDKWNFYIKGNLYTIPFQLIDSVIYSVKKNESVTLKTMTRPIYLNRHQKTIVSMHGESFDTHTFYINLNRKSIPFLLFYFAYYGFKTSIEYFYGNAEGEFISMYSSIPKEPIVEKIFFKYGKLYLGVDRKLFEENNVVRQFVASVLDTQKRGMTVNSIKKVDYWRLLLGAYISQTNSIEVGINLVKTLMTALDNRTKVNIHKLIGGSPKDNVHSVIRWMFLNFTNLLNRGDSLRNKRLRLTEYLITPYIRKIYSNIYRFLKYNDKKRDMEHLYDIFKIPSGILIDGIIGKSKSKQYMVSIAKYNNVSNDLVLLSNALKVVTDGPGSPFENGAGMSLRKIDESFIGNIDLITTTANNPGVQLCLSPFTDIDTDTLTFKNIDKTINADGEHKNNTEEE